LIDLTGLTFDELRQWVVNEMDMKPFRAVQIFGWIHGRRETAFSEMTDISMVHRKKLASAAVLRRPETVEVRKSADGTTKYAFMLDDGEVIESVLIPDRPRLTACLSTQAGCRCRCSFCRTGLSGFRRNLSTAEIVAQLYAMQDISGDRISNVVFMGMGEPMDNFDNVAGALSIISDERGICIGARKITVSTVGLPGGVDRLLATGRQYGLAVSLHSAVPETRRRLVPVSVSLPLSKLKKDLLKYNEKIGRRVTLEYCLISGVNDSPEEAEALIRFAAGLQYKINLLPYNPVEGLNLERPSRETVERFTGYLYPRCQAVTVRRSRGADITAACGQLGLRGGVRSLPRSD